MENREDLKLMLPYLPVLIQSSSLHWPSKVVEALEAMTKGPDYSKVNSGEALSISIGDIRTSLSLFEPMAPFAFDGYALFFDECISRADSAKFFGEIIPVMADFLLRLPSLLESHYQNADDLLGGGNYGLRLLGPQDAGIVVLSQELIGALLACSFFCLFPVINRGANHLRTINFDRLFANLCESYSENQEHKIRCILHYFERICSCMPVGFVSFERKILPLDNRSSGISYPEADFWNDSVMSLCHFEEEIRFMINPELIAGMLFLPSMTDNEAIEIVGAERFSDYIGYASSFRFSGDHMEKSSVDNFGRRKTRIIAIDALCRPGMKQYTLPYLLRETNKAFCGFIDQSKYCQYERLFQDTNGTSLSQALGNSNEKGSQSLNHEDGIGIVTGNWGCGAFGGDPELKTIIQWLAASQASRPFISYYTFGIESLQNLDQVTQWILSQEWTVGDLWNMMVEYSSEVSKRGAQKKKKKVSKRETYPGFYTWLLRSSTTHEASVELHK